MSVVEINELHWMAHKSIL